MENNAHNKFGADGERYARLVMVARGMSVKKMPYRSPFDFLANDKRIEVKTAHKRSNSFQWIVNIHRHGILNESQVDAYIVLLDFSFCGKKKPLTLVIPSPVGGSVLVLTLDSLLTIHNRWVENWGALGISGKVWPKGRSPRKTLVIDSDVVNTK